MSRFGGGVGRGGEGDGAGLLARGEHVEELGRRADSQGRGRNAERSADRQFLPPRNTTCVSCTATRLLTSSKVFLYHSSSDQSCSVATVDTPGRLLPRFLSMPRPHAKHQSLRSCHPRRIPIELYLCSQIVHCISHSDVVKTVYCESNLHSTSTYRYFLLSIDSSLTHCICKYSNQHQVQYP
jgi:hypothetical protein